MPGVDRYYAIAEGKGLIPSVYDGIAAALSHKDSTSPRAAR